MIKEIIAGCTIIIIGCTFMFLVESENKSVERHEETKQMWSDIKANQERMLAFDVDCLAGSYPEWACK